MKDLFKNLLAEVAPGSTLSINEFFEFIEKYAASDPSSLRMKIASNTEREALSFAIDQIECRHRFAGKFRDFIADSRFLFPTSLAGEQATNPQVAAFHASLLDGMVSPERKLNIFDMTSGIGVDALCLASKGNSVRAFDIEPLKTAVLAYNARLKGVDSLAAFCGDSIEYLRSSDEMFDVVFVDPARRDDRGGRVFSFEDCSPDIVTEWQLISSHARRVIVKASPMLDITAVCRQFPGLSAIYVVSLRGECKEVLLDIEISDKTESTDNSDKKNGIREPLIYSVNIDSLGTPHIFSFEGGDITPHFVDENEDFIGKYLYEPDAGAMKIGRWGILCGRFLGLKKLDPSTHLFLSERLYPDFPGRIYKVDRQLQGKELKSMKGKRANVVCRNYVVSADLLAKKTGVIPGDDTYIVGCRYGGGRKAVFLCAKSDN